MLSWSALETGREIDIAGIASPEHEPLLSAGRELIALGHASVGLTPDASSTKAVAAALGDEAAVKAASVAGAFEIFNRVVDAIGLPVGRVWRAKMQHTIDTLDLERFPHATH